VYAIEFVQVPWPAASRDLLDLESVRCAVNNAARRVEGRG